MKILTLAGTRPELIRLCVIIEKLDKILEHRFVYTNQNYDPGLSKIFFDGLDIRIPDYYINTDCSSADDFLGKGILEFSDILNKEKPDKILLLGDTNSSLLAIIAAKRKIPIYHMEAGNRCFDDRVPEELNRKLIDNFSTYNLPYTENSKQNLLKEGFDKNRVFKIGNPIYEVINRFQNEIDSSDILKRLDLVQEEFVLATAHRAENVDNKESLLNIVEALNDIAAVMKVVFSVHPRTRQKIENMSVNVADNVIFSEPFNFFDFVKMEKTAKVVISDSGTVQEECCLFATPSLTIRKSTERQETIECGSNILTGTQYDNIMFAFNTVLNRSYKWQPPKDYLIDNVSDTVINIILGE